MLIQEETVIGGGVIANDCGTGKTYSALAAIRSDYLRKKKSGAKGPFKATVIFAPSPLVNQWMDQYDNKMRGALDTYRFFGTKDSVSGTMADRVLGSLDELNTLLEGLDVNDVEVGLP
jgi:SNF2 family DNA or RNA helicase